MREEIGSTVTVVEETELDKLLQEIKEEPDEAAEQYDASNQTRQQEIETSRANAEGIRTIAMENLSETRKRRSEEESPNSSKQKRNTGSETMVYLRTRAENDLQIRKEELELKKNTLEHEKTQQNQFFTILEQQRQMQAAQQQQMAQQNESLIRLVELLAKKMFRN